MVLNYLSHQQAGSGVKPQFHWDADRNGSSLDVFIKYFDGQFIAGGKKVAYIIKPVIDGSVQQGFRIDQSCQTILNFFVNIFISRLVQMPLIKMKQSSHNLKKM